MLYKGNIELSTKKISAIVSFLMLLSVALGIFLGSWFVNAHNGSVAFAGVVLDTLYPSPEAVLNKKAANIVNRMNYREKLGQMVMIGVRGTEVNSVDEQMLSQYHIGNIILFDRNIKSWEQTTKLVADLQKVAMEKGGQPVPLLVAIDEEGGRVVRGKDVIEPPPAQKSIGETNNPANAEEWARKTGKNLQALGINVNFAPVADVAYNVSRDFSGDYDKATSFVKAAARGYSSVQEIFTLKHFPGIGRGTVDSHKDVSSIDVSLEELRQTDLKPFQAVIDENKNHNFFVMISHLKYPQLDKDNTASQSYNIITNLLRHDMGFNGLVITDDMAMGAVSKYGSFSHTGVNAVKAGADIVLICHEHSHQVEIYNGLVAAYEAGELDKNKIDASVRRIVKAKLRLNTLIQ